MRRRESRFESKMVSVRRVAKVTSGAKRLRFSAMVVVGDRKGTVGIALGRGTDTRSAIEKAIKKAEKTAVKIEIIGDTIPHETLKKIGAAKVLLRPAKPGTGVIAGSSVRTVLELCGIDNVYGKIIGSSNLVANTYCTFEALKSLKSARVLQKMTSMRDRLNLKEQLDKERKKRESLLRKKFAKENKGKKDNRNRGSNRRGRRNFKRTDKKTSVQGQAVDNKNKEIKKEVVVSKKNSTTDKETKE